MKNLRNFCGLPWYLSLLSSALHKIQKYTPEIFISLALAWTNKDKHCLKLMEGLYWDRKSLSGFERLYVRNGETFINIETTIRPPSNYWAIFVYSRVCAVFFSSSSYFLIFGELNHPKPRLLCIYKHITYFGVPFWCFLLLNKVCGIQYLYRFHLKR